MAAQDREIFEIVLGTIMTQSAILDFLIKQGVIESAPLTRAFGRTPRCLGEKRLAEFAFRDRHALFNCSRTSTAEAPWAAKLASRGKFLRKIASAELSILKTSILHHGGQPNILARDRPRYFFEIGFTLVLVAPGTHIRL
jgi:hypothetical protein